MHLKKTCCLNGFHFAIILMAILTSFSCTKSTPDTPASGTLTGFSFLTENNKTITVSSSATISGKDVKIFLPPGTNPDSLVATFNLTDSANVTVNGVDQQTGVTANDFSSPLSYVLLFANGSIQTYTVTLITDIAAIDQNVTQFMTTYHVPALAIAITKDEKLVYAKSYGYADMENNQLAQNNNLFRLASLSKQITSVAIMRLMDQGKLNIEDRVFGDGGILGTTYGTQPYGSGIEDITINHLLHHTCGGWSNDDTTYPDPMFLDPTMTREQVIDWTLDNIPLENAPGDNYDYSNFGYCLLGRVIEKVTGLSYEDAAKKLVLEPCGITDMRIGGNTLAQRLTNEVKYYGQNFEDPYAYNITRMDSHGGWIASATDLAKFMVHVDGTGDDILSADAMYAMMTPSTANPGYACGWIINPYSWWHNGSLPGTQTEQVITTKDGYFNFAILTNTPSSDDNFGDDMDNIFWNAVPNIHDWPQYNLFQ
ncbi:MAG: serine hydrolase domain-containing protein [Agriterribacter sp.]